MKLNEAISKRILNLCNERNITINHLAEISIIPPSTLRDLVNLKRKNCSLYIILTICKVLKISLKDFFDDPLFNNKNLIEY